MAEEATPAPAAEETVVETVEQTEAPKEAPKERSRRSALEDAFAKVEAAETRDAEEMHAKAAGEGTDAAEGRKRGPDGKFAAKDAPKEAPKDSEAKPEEAPEEPEKPKGDFAEPPSRFSPDAKAEWEKAPQSVRAEMHRAIREMESGLAQKDEDLKPLKPYLDRAKQAGQNLGDVIKTYDQMEQFLRKDPVQGIMRVAQNLGLSIEQVMGQAIQRGFVKVNDKGQVQQRQQPDMNRVIQQAVGPLAQQVNQLRQESAQTRAERVVQEFSQAHPRVNEEPVSQEMARMLQSGYASDLEDAYRKATAFHPEAPQPAAQQPPPPPAQTRQGKSVTGAPAAGSNPATSKPSANRREALERGMRMAGILS